MELRYCIKCEQDLPLDNFYIRKDGRNRNVCKQCMIVRIHYTANCNVTINTNSARYRWELLKQLYNKVGKKPFSGNVIKEMCTLKEHHKLLTSNVYIRIDKEYRVPLANQQFRLTTSAIDYINNAKTCGKKSMK